MTLPRPAPTLMDVAKLSGFSTATVSRCLNFPDQVSAKTRALVADAIAALGYSPNFGARVMASSRTNTIGAVIPTMENAIFARGLQAFQEELDAQGYTLLVASSSYSADREAAQIRALVARGADALLLIGHHRDPEIYRFLAAQNVPVLVSWAFDNAFPQPSVGFDNRCAMAALARQVLVLGHRRLALISAHLEVNDRARGRLQGIWDAMDEVGLARGTLHVVETSYGIETGAQAFAEVMARSPRPTAVLCGNDVLAAGAVGQARAMGLDVPGDVSVTGFDDIDLAQVVYPALSTVHVPHRRMGQLAAQSLIASLQGGGAPVSHEVEAELCPRASLGPVPKDA